MKFFNVYDSIAGVYYGPYIAHNTGDAIRVIRGVFATLADDHPMRVNAADLRLFEIGDYDPETSNITGAPHRVALTTLAGV